MCIRDGAPGLESLPSGPRPTGRTLTPKEWERRNSRYGPCPFLHFPASATHSSGWADDRKPVSRRSSAQEAQENQYLHERCGRIRLCLSHLRQCRIGHGDDVLLSLRQDDHVIDGPLIVALARVQRLPPAETCAGRFRGQREFIMNKPEPNNIIQSQTLA